MAFLPFWPKTATTLYNLLAFCGFMSLAAVGLGTVGGSTAKWVRPACSHSPHRACLPLPADAATASADAHAACIACR
jgi:hypothetical protein